MTVVKGSKQYRMEVVAYRPWLRFFVRLILLVLVAVAVSVSYYAGDYLGRQGQRDAVAELNQLKAELQGRQSELDELRQQVANLQLGAEVDQKASEDVRTQVIELKDKIAEQQEVISFYKGLMSPTANQRGLTIGSVNLVATGEARRYQYKVVVQQLATDHQLLSGYLNFAIVGRLNDVPTTLQLASVSPNVTTENIRLRFKYFQTIEGSLVLPEGFEPERIELTATSTGTNAAVVEKKFGWLVQES